jgi:hypothetical protein
VTRALDPALVASVEAAIRLRDAVAGKGEVYFRCPNEASHNHADADPSARWNPKKAMWYCDPCHEGGGAVDLAQRLGIETRRRSRKPPPPVAPDDVAKVQASLEKAAARKGEKKPKFARATIETTYYIRDAEGRLVAEHLRYDPAPGAEGAKSFKWRREGKNSLGGLAAAALPLYRSEDLKALPDGAVVLVTEGEKPANALRDRGIPAVGTVCGAGTTPCPSSLQPLVRLDPVLWADNDRAGEHHMMSIAGRLLDTCKAPRASQAPRVRLFRWPEAPKKGDAFDFFEKGGTMEEFRILLDASAPVEASRRRVPPEATVGDSGSPVVLKPLRPEVHVRDQLTRVVDEAEALLLADPRAAIFVRARMLVRVLRDGTRPRDGVRRPPRQPVISPYTAGAFRERLDRTAEWSKWSATYETWVAALPPSWVVETLLERGEWAFPPLEAVVEAPCLRSDGTVLCTPGYDEATGLLYEPTCDYPPIPEAPTLEEARTAAALLLDPFCDFPFLSETSRAAVLAAVLTCIARAAIDGPVPMFASRAPGPGTGKGLVVETIAYIVTGRTPSLVTHVSDPDEMRKRILAVAVEGLPLVLVDNLDGVMGSSVFAAALTAREWTDRYLGVSKMVTAPLRTVWFVNGNNLRFGATLGRRVIPIDMDAKMEHPEDRGGFRYPEILSHVLEVRPQLVAAALTVLRAFAVAGRPRHGKVPMGSYESWDRWVRACCVWVGMGDPAGTDDSSSGRGRIRAESDEDLESLRGLLTALQGAFGEETFTAADALSRAAGEPVLMEALRTVALTKKGTIDGRSVGNAFKDWRGRIVEGLSLDLVASAKGGVKTWRVAGAPCRVSQGESLFHLAATNPPSSTVAGAGADRPESESPRPTQADPAALPGGAVPPDPEVPATPGHAVDCDCRTCIPPSTKPEEVPCPHCSARPGEPHWRGRESACPSAEPLTALGAGGRS